MTRDRSPNHWRVALDRSEWPWSWCIWRRHWDRWEKCGSHVRWSDAITTAHRRAHGG